MSNSQEDLTHEYANVLGVDVSAINMTRAVALADAWIQRGDPGYVCVTGVHGVMEAQNDPTFLQILNGAAINTPDGMPLSWVGWLQGHRKMNRVYGPDFMLELCRFSVERGYRHFFYGGKEGIAQELASALQGRFPGLQVASSYTPPFRPLTDEEEAELEQLVETSKPHVLWVGLSTPKQERFMSAYVNRLQVPLMIGVGAAFDMHTGRTKEAPRWMMRAGLQWFHRLCHEPKRLARRYLVNNPIFVAKITRQLFFQR